MVPIQWGIILEERKSKQKMRHVHKISEWRLINDSWFTKEVSCKKRSVLSIATTKSANAVSFKFERRTTSPQDKMEVPLAPLYNWKNLMAHFPQREKAKVRIWKISVIFLFPNWQLYKEFFVNDRWAKGQSYHLLFYKNYRGHFKNTFFHH